MAVKKKEHEKLDNANIRYVIGLLEKDSPITKKEACSILNISYNTSRLNKIIENFKEKEEYAKKRKAELKGRKATDQEISQIVQEYLTGENVTNIASSLYRSPGFVKNVVLKVGIPIKPVGDDKYKTSLLPEQCISESFEPGEVVWSASYNSPAEVICEISGNYESKYDSKAYRIYVFESIGDISESYFPGLNRGGFYAASAAYDLGSLKHLEKYKINWSRI